MSLTTHVPLVDVIESPPWAGEEPQLPADLGGCAQCHDIEHAYLRIIELIAQANTLAPKLLSYEKQMLDLQSEFRSVRQDITKAVRILKAFSLHHERCALCTILVGEQHAVGALVKEPFGEQLVCPACYRTLKSQKLRAKDARDHEDEA